jgi:hypothetical protein
LDLVVAGIVVFAFLLASYSTRREWIALGSMAVSIAALAGCLFLYATPESSHIRASLAALAEELPSGWDQRVKDLSAAIERTSTALVQARKRTADHGPFLTASITRWFAAAPQWVAAAPKAESEPAPASNVSSEVPIKWVLDEPSPATNGTFALSGANVSDQPLEAVQAVLKPDSGADELVLVLDVEDGNGGTGAVIPPGARFRLAADRLTADEAKQLGGAILSVSYVQAGRRKSSIMYLTPPMLAQHAKRD